MSLMTAILRQRIPETILVRLQVVNDVKKVERKAGKPVDARDKQEVARIQCSDCAISCSLSIFYLLGQHFRCTCLRQLLDPARMILIGSRDACVVGFIVAAYWERIYFPKRQRIGAWLASVQNIGFLPTPPLRTGT